MKHRSPAAVFLLSLVTFGIYAIVWHVKTKNELNNLGADIPTAWLLIVPLANLYWIWKYSEGVEKVTGGKISAVLCLILLLLLSIVGLAILQSQYNSLGLQAVSPVPGTPPGGVPPAPTSYTPTAPIAPGAPTAPLAPINPYGDTSADPISPPVGTPIFPTTPPVPPTINDPTPPIQPPSAPPNLPPAPIQ